MSPDRKVFRDISEYASRRRLVEESTEARPDKARKAKRHLFAALGEDQTMNTIVDIVEISQTILISAKDPRRKKRGCLLLGEVISEHERLAQGNETIDFSVGPIFYKTLRGLEEKDKLLDRDRYVQMILPPNYRRIVNLALKAKKIFEERGSKTGEYIRFFDRPSDLPNFDEIQESWNKWSTKITEAVNSEQKQASFPDELIDLLKSEPKREYTREGQFFVRKHADLSLQDFESLQFPLSDADFDRVAKFLITFWEKDKIPLYVAAISQVIFYPWFFESSAKRKIEESPNKKMLSVISSWQASFFEKLVSDKNPEKDELIGKILELMPASAVWRIVLALKEWFLSSYFDNPKILEGGRIRVNPEEKLEFSSVEGRGGVIHVNQLVEKDFLELCLPQLERRLKHFGVLSRFAGPINVARDIVKERPFMKELLKSIKEAFEKNSGGEFLNKLDQHKEELSEISEGVWQSIKDGSHFLPMSEGENIIEFSQGNVPALLGIDKIIFWGGGNSILINFDVKGFDLVTGKIDLETGRVEFEVPIEEEAPGLYAMLKHIALLTLHDLVIQQKRDTTVKISAELSPEEAIKERKSNEGAVEHKQTKHGSSLPRVQTDAELIESVYKKTGYKPRRVELHKKLLNGARDYKTAVSKYNQALEDPVSTGTVLESYSTEVELCRRKLHRTSEHKKKDLPSLFKLEVMVDPITGEERYMETWVIEHTSPTPTEDELKSPVKLFERYYRNSSALASLEQLKPWFVGL